MDSRAKGIAEAVRERLATVAGWETYPVDKAVRAPVFSELILDESLTTVASVHPAGRIRVEQETFTTKRAEMVLAIAMATKHTPASEHPHQAESGQPLREDKQLDLLAEAERKLLAGDRTLGGKVIDITVLDWDADARDTFIRGWAIAYLRVSCLWSYAVTAP